MRVVILVWLVLWIVVAVGALRAVTTLQRLADDPAPCRDDIDATARRARRWAVAMIVLGCAMALVSPWAR